MHPAFSVIFFTVSSGTGYGLLFILGILGGVGKLPNDPVFGSVALIVGMVFVAAGLLSSLFHLGHPERAWRAFSQWRTSWLSREGVTSTLSFLPAIGMLYLWLFETTEHPLFALVSWLTAFFAVVTVYCTAMIYRSLPPIHQWANGWTAPAYLTMALAGGGVVLVALYAAFGVSFTMVPLCATGALIAAWGVKTGYWLFVDLSQGESTAETATGLGTIGTVRQLEAPHTEDNYLLKEMGFRVGQKHADKLRRYAKIFGFLVPIILMIATYFDVQFSAIILSLLAVVSFAIGAIAERWLFFAQARHTVTLYYGR